MQGVSQMHTVEPVDGSRANRSQQSPIDVSAENTIQNDILQSMPPRKGLLVFTIVAISVCSLLFSPPFSETALARRPSVQRRDRRPDREISIPYTRTDRKKPIQKAQDPPPATDQETDSTPQDRRATPPPEPSPRQNPPSVE